MKAWMVRWDGTDVGKDCFVTVLSARKSPDQVKQIIEMLYSVLKYSPEEKLAKANYHSPNIIVPARLENTEEGQIITCGHNPFLKAFRANVEIKIGNAGEKLIKYMGHKQGISNKWSGSLLPQSLNLF